MDPWKKFIEELGIVDKLIEVYFNIRLIFQREKWSTKDLERPPYYPQDLMRLFQIFSNERDNIFNTVREYGFNVDSNDLTNYIQDKLKKIDETTPLND